MPALTGSQLYALLNVEDTRKSLLSSRLSVGIHAPAGACNGARSCIAGQARDDVQGVD